MPTNRSIAASLRARENYHVAHSAEETTTARRLDKQTHALLRKLAKLPENSRCADCSAPYPGWAALPHGVFLCIDCAQHHRRVGRHISQVKAINTGTYLWHPDEAAVMQATGNAVAAKIYLARHPQKAKAIGGDFQFVQDKYDRKRWALSEQELQRHAREGELDGAVPAPIPESSAPETSSVAGPDCAEEKDDTPETEATACAPAMAPASTATATAPDWFHDVMSGQSTANAGQEGAHVPVPASPPAAFLTVAEPQLLPHRQVSGDRQSASGAVASDALEARRKAELHQEKVRQVMSFYGSPVPAQAVSARPVGASFFAQFGV